MYSAENGLLREPLDGAGTHLRRRVGGSDFGACDAVSACGLRPRRSQGSRPQPVSGRVPLVESDTVLVADENLELEAEPSQVVVLEGRGRTAFPERIGNGRPAHLGSRANPAPQVELGAAEHVISVESL